MYYGARYDVVTWRGPEVCKEPRMGLLASAELHRVCRTCCAVYRCSVELSNWCYILKLG